MSEIANSIDSVEASTEEDRLDAFIQANHGLEVVVVQGLGFVGGAMAAALANARDRDGNPRFAVIGVDLPDIQGARKIGAARRGEPPIVSLDPALLAAYEESQ